MIVDSEKNLGKNIMLARKSLGLKQRDLADKLGINHANISRIESGEQQPTAEQLISIAQALNTTVGVLVGETVGLDVPPSTLAEFTAWCESRGFKSDIYHELALWLMQHLSPASRDEAMEAMKNNEDKIFTFSDCPGPESDEEKAILAAAKDRLEKSSDKNQKETG